MHYQILPLWFLQVNFFFPVFNSSKMHIYLAKRDLLILVSTILFYFIPYLTPPKCIYTWQNNVQLLIWPYFIVQKHTDFVELIYSICSMTQAT
jgi:hypothetical protein